MNTNTNTLEKSIRNAVSLFAEFGSRNEYIRKGRVIVTNDVTDPEAEGVFLARCARKIARKQGVVYAYEWALQQFTKGAYNRLKTRNMVFPTMAQVKAQTRRIELGLTA